METTALDDLQYLSDLIQQLVGADKRADDPEAFATLSGMVERSLKSIATVHFDYNREIFADYDRHLAAHGMRATIDLCN